MHFQNVLTTTLIAAISASAAPAPAPSTSDGSTWTVQSFLRTCDAADTQCNYSFTLNSGSLTPCSYSVTGSPASHASYNNIACGSYVVSSNWSDQFGVDAGFSTLAITDKTSIIFPAYTDKQLASGQVVTPDQSYPTQAVF